MTKEQYEQWSEPYRKNKLGQNILIMADKFITALVFVSYPVFLFYSLWNQSTDEFIKVFLIPAAAFFAVSVFRKSYSASRPYEIWDIEPLLKKDTRGKSFPSRHVFSVFILGMAYFHTIKVLGITLFFSGALLAFIRVIGGVHFPKDVVAGAFFGILSGLLFWIS